MRRLSFLALPMRLRRFAMMVTILFVVSQLHVPVLAQSPYTNPVLGDSQRVAREIADPFVLQWNGEYYLYCSGNPITAYHSTDLVTWDSIGPVFAASNEPEAWNQADVWAPEVAYRNGKFYMYYTASKKSDDWRVGEMARRIGVAVSDRPEGPFVDSGRPVIPGWGIDGTVFKDPDTGEEYLFYSYLYEPRLPGAGIVADRLNAWNAVTGVPSHVTRGSEAWEDKDGDPNNGSVRYTNEAPTVLKRHGRYYMMYSGGSWDLPTYALAYATSERIIQGGLDGPGWRKVVPPILRSTSLVEAPGHNAVVKAPNNVDDICVYHARVIPFLSPGNRLPFVDRLYWNHDRMFMQQPTLGDLAPPDRPLFSDNFNRVDGPLGSSWETRGGAWRVFQGHAVQGQTDGASSALARVEKLTNYIFEANLRITLSSQSTSTGVAGVAAYYADANNHIDVWLDAGRRALITTGVIDGVPVSEQTSTLPTDFRFDVYHQLLITKNGNHIKIALDEVNKQNLTFEKAANAGTVALLTQRGAADFDGIAITPFYEDAFGTPSVSMWSVQSGTWLTEEGALHQVSGGAGRAITLKGDPAENYEFSASLRWRDNESVTSKAGIVAAATEANEMVLGGFDKTIWPLARFWVQHIVQGVVKDSFSVGLPRGFDYNEYHTIRVVKQGTALTFFLDGKEVFAHRFAIGSTRPGLFTEGVRAAFDDCMMKRLVVSQNLILNAGFETEQWDGRAASKDNPWKLSGGARPNDCCAHSGLRRIIITGNDGEAAQSISGLSPGRYTLHAWVSATSGAEAAISVKSSNSSPMRMSVTGDQWTRASLDFTIPEKGGPVTVSFTARLQQGSRDFAAADDFYLFKN